MPRWIDLSAHRAALKVEARPEGRALVLLGEDPAVLATAAAALQFEQDAAGLWRRSDVRITLADVRPHFPQASVTELSVADIAFVAPVAPVAPVVAEPSPATPAPDPAEVSRRAFVREARCRMGDGGTQIVHWRDHDFPTSRISPEAALGDVHHDAVFERLVRWRAAPAEARPRLPFAVMADYGALLQSRQAGGRGGDSPAERACRNTLALLSATGIAERLLDEATPRLALRWPPYNEVVVEGRWAAGVPQIVLTQFLPADTGGAIDSELVFAVAADGGLQLQETAVHNVFRGGVIRGRDARYADTWSARLVEQGFEAAVPVWGAGAERLVEAEAPAGAPSAAALPPSPRIGRVEVGVNVLGERLFEAVDGTRLRERATGDIEAAMARPSGYDVAFVTRAELHEARAREGVGEPGAAAVVVGECLLDRTVALVAGTTAYALEMRLADIADVSAWVPLRFQGGQWEGVPGVAWRERPTLSEMAAGLAFRHAHVADPDAEPYAFDAGDVIAAINERAAFGDYRIATALNEDDGVTLEFRDTAGVLLVRSADPGVPVQAQVTAVAGGGVRGYVARVVASGQPVARSPRTGFDSAVRWAAEQVVDAARRFRLRVRPGQETLEMTLPKARLAQLAERVPPAGTAAGEVLRDVPELKLWCERVGWAHAFSASRIEGDSAGLTLTVVDARQTTVALRLMPGVRPAQVCGVGEWGGLIDALECAVEYLQQWSALCDRADAADIRRLADALASALGQDEPEAPAVAGGYHFAVARALVDRDVLALAPELMRPAGHARAIKRFFEAITGVALGDSPADVGRAVGAWGGATPEAVEALRRHADRVREVQRPAQALREICQAAALTPCTWLPGQTVKSAVLTRLREGWRLSPTGDGLVSDTGAQGLTALEREYAQHVEQLRSAVRVPALMDRPMARFAAG